jgi:DNA repair protein RadC
MPEKPDHLEHRKRLRERFEKAGADGLHDIERLELLLTYAIPRLDVKPVARALIKRFKSLSGVLDASYVELKGINGLGPASAVLIRLVKELLVEYLAEQMKKRDALSSPQAVLNFARAKLAGLPHEAFMVIFVDVKNQVIDHDVLNEGTVDRAVVYPRRIIESALTRHAAGVILSHNHPSGDPEPSEEDKRLTRSVVEAARTIELRVLDHLIVGKAGYFSFHENRLLA